MHLRKLLNIQMNQVGIILSQGTVFSTSTQEPKLPDCFLLNMLLAGCEAYNLGTGKGTSVLEIVNAFEKASGKV